MFSTMFRSKQIINRLYHKVQIMKKFYYMQSKLKLNGFKKLFIPTSLSLFYIYHTNKSKLQCSQLNQIQSIQQIQKFKNRRNSMEIQTLLDGNKSLLSSLWSILCHTLRFFQILLIFSPVLLLYPLKYFNATRGVWLDIFVKSVETAGVVWIKAFQYISHRRDVVGPQMADKFVHLREKAPQHSFEQTKKQFLKLYNKKIQQVFDQFDQKPIASGSVCQVYKAVYKGKKVAVKVRHPNVQKHIQRDVNLLFFFSRFLSQFSKSFKLPVSQISMKKTLMDQINLENQKDNLLIFNQMFRGNKQVKFPRPFVQSTSQAFLVETFIEGVPISYYETNKHPLNAVMARIGAITFFQMLVKYNFIHADCHGGNILIQVQQKRATFFSQIWSYLKQKFQKLQSYLVQNTINNQGLKKIYVQSKKQEQRIRKLIRSCKQKVVVTLIDVGMVIRLQDNDKINFVNFIKNILGRDGEKCAQTIYNLSIFDGEKIRNTGGFQKYLNELRQLFLPLQTASLQQVQSFDIVVGMLNIIRQNNMQLEGQFATLLTNMLVLEGIVKDLDPSLKVLNCAVPYFKYIQQKQRQESLNYGIRQVI